MSNVPKSKYAPNTLNTIPARSGVAVPLSSGQKIRVINTHGTQVIDTWCIALNSAPPTYKHLHPTPTPYFMSMCHTRAATLHLTPLPGDVLVCNNRAPVLKFVSDTSQFGVHDTLMAACDIHRYHGLGVPETEYHDSCADNFRNALLNDIPQDYALYEALTTGFRPSPPDPLNLWMNIPVQLRKDVASTGRDLSAGGDLSFDAPVSAKGDEVVLQALVDCVVVMSACPQDILLINAKMPTEAHFVVEG